MQTERIITRFTLSRKEREQLGRIINIGRETDVMSVRVQGDVTGRLTWHLPDGPQIRDQRATDLLSRWADDSEWKVQGWV